MLSLMGVALCFLVRAQAPAIPGPGPGPPPSICALLALNYSLQANATPTLVCAGNQVTLNAQFWHKVSIFNLSFWLPQALPPNSYTWFPTGNFANPNLQTQVVTPASTITYTVRVTFANCVFTRTVQVVVVPNTVIANAGQDRAIIPPATTMLGGNPAPLGGPIPSGSGGMPPYTYSWTPAATLNNNLIANPLAGPSTQTTYTLQVTDAAGCKATDEVIVYIQTNNEYAVLLKQLDGSYYTPVNNKLYFTIDGEYSAMTLNYTVYNYQRSPQPGLPINVSTLANGDNRYELTITTLPVGYYVLEVENQKREKLFLRFRK